MEYVPVGRAISVVLVMRSGVAICMQKAAARIAVLLGLLFLSACATPGDDLRFDILIDNGNVYTGDNRPSQTATVGIRGDRIVYVGAADPRFKAERRIDARGLLVAPGFMDPHTHSLAELSSDDKNGNVNYLTQGVTTVVNGNDGGGPTDIADTLERLRSGGIGTNTALFVGHGTVRKAVLGMQDRVPDAGEMEKMKRLVDAAMTQGALGLSTGLYYAPGSFADTEEIVTLAKVAAQHDGIYDSHIRDESSYTIGFLASLEEALRIGREANIPVHIAHIKALGVDVWGQSEQAIALIEAAQRRGQVVTADQYPWRASGTHLRNTLISRWVMAGSDEQFRQRLRDPALLPKIKAEMRENLRRRGGPESLLIVQAKDPTLIGNTLGAVARARKADPINTAIDIVLAGSTRVASFNMKPEDIENFMQRDWVMTSSDGTDGHPRKFASFPKKFHDYVIKKPLLSVAAFVHRSSAMVADTFGIAERGYLKPGYFADVIVFDKNTFAPRANFKHWDRLSKGMEYVLVNGVVAVDDGRYTGALAGRGLTRN